MNNTRLALIVGAGDGLSAALARALARDGGWRVALASRHPDRLEGLTRETGAAAFACDARNAGEVEALFERLDRDHPGALDLVIYNPSVRVAGAITELDPTAVADALAVNAFGGFLVAQQAARRLVARGSGTILFTGASASVKGYARSAPFAMGKFALRGLAQSLARELAPQGVHVAHIVIDGVIRHPGRPVTEPAPDALLAPDAIAQNYLHLARQDRSAWTWEIELRPWVERF